MTADFRVTRVSAALDTDLRQWFSEADAQRQAQILRFTRTDARKQCLCADHLLRQMLAERGISPLFARDANGKPFLTNAPLHFNLSHSGDFAACAVAQRPIGIDIEAVRQVSPSLAERICTAGEREWVYAGGGFDSTRLLQVWTGKEAYLKYLGCGLRRDPKDIDVVSGGSFLLDGLRLHSVQNAEYVLSVVYEEASAWEPL